MPNSQLKAASVLASALSCLTLFLFAGEAPQDPLWRKAVALASANSDWVPGLVIIRTEVLFKGESAGVHEMWRRSRLGQNGEVVTETIKVLEDGKDITKHEKTSKAKGDPKKPDNKGSVNPFDSGVQGRVSLKVIDRSRDIAGRSCAGYAFELRNTNGPAAKGTAWLEKETGIPREIENITLDPFPDKHLKRMAMTSRYETTTNGGWQLKTVETAGTVSRLFINADFRSTTTFSEFWQKPERDKALQRDTK